MSSRKIGCKYLFIPIAVIILGIASWMYFHPIVASLAVMSGSISDAKQKNTYICQYAIACDAVPVNNRP